MKRNEQEEKYCVHTGVRDRFVYLLPASLSTNINDRFSMRKVYIVFPQKIYQTNLEFVQTHSNIFLFYDYFIIDKLFANCSRIVSI